MWNDVKSLFTKNRIPDPKSLYILNRILSYSPLSFNAANRANRYIGRLPNWATVQYLYYSIPKQQRSPWINYDKYQKDEKSEVISKVAAHFCCSKYHAEQIVQILILREGRNPHSDFGIEAF